MFGLNNRFINENDEKQIAIIEHINNGYASANELAQATDKERTIVIQHVAKAVVLVVSYGETVAKDEFFCKASDSVQLLVQALKDKRE